MKSWAWLTQFSPLMCRALVSVCLIFCFWLMTDASFGQEPPKDSKGKDAQAQGATGSATGVPRPAVKDALSRPITAGGFVSDAPVVFADITKQSGLGKFLHISGTAAKETILETMGSGVALLDYDNDGWLDIYLVNASTFAAMKGLAPAPRAMLLHNNHDGTFTDVTEKAGVALGGWSTGPTWGDYDHDGLLDLFVPGYVKFDVNHPPISGQGTIPANFCQFRGIAVMCGPRGLPGEEDHLFHNNGDGTFTDVSVKAGVADKGGRFGMSAVFVDVDDDGWLDLVVANDSTTKYLYR